MIHNRNYANFAEHLKSLFNSSFHGSQPRNPNLQQQTQIFTEL